MNELELEDKVIGLQSENEDLRNRLNRVQTKCDALDRENQIIRTAMSGFIKAKIFQIGIAAICMAVCLFFAGVQVGKLKSTHYQVTQQPLK
ncbi:bZIP transcription factor [Burkholderia vietnamiensis]|nr:bZIP transcription factor [Burkholderia vietnamiensis]